MLGLIKKDFLLIKANVKSILIIFAVFFLLALQGSFDVTYIIPFMGLILVISTFSYDEFNNWYAYALTLPNGRKNIVKAKYIATILFVVLLELISLIVTMGIRYVRTNIFDFDGIISSLAGVTVGYMIVISFMYPLMFRFGSTNGRIILFAVVFGVAGAIGAIAHVTDAESVGALLNQFDHYGLMVSIGFAVGLLFISYLVSNRIFQQKEF